MKGIVFTEFLEMVENSFSMTTVESIIESANLPTEGVYTAVGTYDYQELVKLVVELNKITRVAIPELLQAFGKYLFQRFVVLYPQFIEKHNSTFSLLDDLENYIHIEVKKLYPDAELPSFDVKKNDGTTMNLTYKSCRALSDFAQGLISGCSEHYKEQINIEKQDVSENKGTCVEFTLTRK